MWSAIGKDRSISGSKHLSDLLLGAISGALKLDHVAGWLLSAGVDHLRNGLIERMMARRVEVALGREGIVATQSAEAIPLVRRCGFYLGPMRPDGVERLAAQAQPYPARPGS